MSIFNLDDDVAKFLLRMTATLERVDGAVAEAQMLTREIRELLNAVKVAAAVTAKTP